MAKAVIHVNRHFIAANAKDGGNRPVFTAKRGGKTMYARRIEINGPSELVYGDKPLSCGAKAWIETYAPLILHDPMTWKEARQQGN